MFQIDNSTAVAAIPAPTPAGSAGYFTDGNPATGVSATILPAEFMNMLMMENLNVLSAGGMAPVKGQYNQLALAINKIVQAAAQRGNTTYALDTGVANIYVCAFSPAIVTRFEGQILRFKVKTTNTGASTFNDGLGAVPVVGGAHTPLQGGELFATGNAWVQWNSSIGSGSYILLFCTGAPEQITPGTQSNHAATLGQIGAATISYGLDTGAANAYAVTYSPPVTAVVDGLALRFKAANANTGPSTFNPNGLGTKPLVGTGHVALQGGEIVSTSEVWVQYNSTFGGTGAWVLIESTGGALQIPPATQSQQAINLSQANSTFAALAGNSAQAFSVAAASTGSQAVNLTQANAAYAAAAGNSANNFNVLTASTATQATPLAQVQSLVAGSPTVQGAFKNLRLLATGTGRNVSVSADEIVLESPSNQYVTLRGVSITGNNGTGMDTGSVAASTWYSVWLIYNGSTQFVLFSLSTTSPTMPGGYTYKARIGWIRTDSTANAYPLGFIQAGRSFKYVLAAGSNMTAFPQMASGVSGSISTPSYSSIAVSSFFPPTAGVIETIVGVAAPNGFVMIAADSAYGAYTSSTNIPFTYSAGTNGPYSSGFARFILDTPNIYWASSLAGNTLNALGWEDNL